MMGSNDDRNGRDACPLTTLSVRNRTRVVHVVGIEDQFKDALLCSKPMKTETTLSKFKIHQLILRFTNIGYTKEDREESDRSICETSGRTALHNNTYI